MKLSNGLINTVPGKWIKLKNRQYAQAKQMAQSGMSRAMIAQHLGMSVATLYRRIDSDEKLRAALSEGDSQDLQMCVDTLREKALKGSAQHMDRYLQLRHGIYIGGAKPQGFDRRDGPVIVVVPFETGQDKWDNTLNNHMLSDDGDVIEHDQDDSQDESESCTALIHHDLYDKKA